MTTVIQVEANIASNLIQLCIDQGLPSLFCDADVQEILTDDLHNDSWKFNNLRRIKNAVHEVLYAPPRS